MIDSELFILITGLMGVGFSLAAVVILVVS